MICLKFTAEQLGFNGYIPPYATARGRDILRGVNYASAAAGIRDETGRQLVLFILKICDAFQFFFSSIFFIQFENCCFYEIFIGRKDKLFWTSE